MVVILAIESAIAGGSLSLIRDGEELGNWICRNAGILPAGGGNEYVRAGSPRSGEGLLVNIDALLTACSVSKHDIDLVAVSAGPGSFTGIRIGIATALGLKAGLGIPMTSVSALHAIACRNAGILPAGGENENGRPGSPRSDINVAVPVGRNSVCIQSFRVGEKEVIATNDPRTIPDTEIERFADVPLVMHAALFEKYSSLPNAVDFGANIAYAVGQLGAASPGTLTEPLFISKSF